MEHIHDRIPAPYCAVAPASPFSASQRCWLRHGPAAAARRGQHLLLPRAGLINPLLEAFTKATGIKTNVVFAKTGLIERLEAESKNSPADVLLTNESGLLLQAVAAGVTQPVHSAVLEGAIPAELRDPTAAGSG